MTEREFNPPGPGVWWVLCRDGKTRLMRAFVVETEMPHYLMDLNGKCPSKWLTTHGTYYIDATHNWDVMRILGPVEIPSPPKPKPVYFDGPGLYRRDDGSVVYVGDSGKFLYMTSPMESTYVSRQYPFAAKLATWDAVIEWAVSR